MKKCFSIGTLVLIICSLAACQEGLSSSYSSGSSDASNSSFDSSSQSSSSSFVDNKYQPIGPSSDISILSNDITFSLSAPTITKEQAENLINNDLSLYPEEQSSHKKTCIKSEKKESHVTENRSTATYSVKDLIEEKHSITQLDSDNKWYYSKSIENTTTVYFVEDTLYRHTIREQLYFVQNGYFYQVHSNKSYYEGMEDRGSYETFYYKTPDSLEEGYNGAFTLHLESYVYFNGQSKLNKLDKTILDNFRSSSSFYYSPNYSSMERHPNYKFHSSGEKGDFGCVIEDDYDYRFEDLNDYPSMEANELRTISYHQDYLLNISGYFTYDEDYLTKSVSKSGNGKVIRDETHQGRKKMFEGCEVFYPDLSTFEERAYDPITRK